MSKSTYTALLGRGISSDTAQSILRKKLNISKLKQMNVSQLVKLGIEEKIALNILNENRPPIPDDVVFQLLEDNNFCCCVCKNQKTGIIIHHIDKWERCHSHEPSNLVVLCLNHHNEAHTHHELSRNLDAKALRYFKTSWEQEIKENRVKQVQKAISTNDASWDYINYRRLIELYDKYKLTYPVNKYSEYLRSIGYIKPNGLLDISSQSKDSQRWFSRFEEMYVISYLESLATELLANVPVKYLNPSYSFEYIKGNISVGDIIIMDGFFYIKNLSGNQKGTDQIRRAVCKLNRSVVSYEFDAWMSNSSSSHNVHLVGNKNYSAVVIAKDIGSNDKETLVINCSCLGMGLGLTKESNKFI